MALLGVSINQNITNRHIVRENYTGSWRHSRFTALVKVIDAELVTMIMAAWDILMVSNCMSRS